MTADALDRVMNVEPRVGTDRPGTPWMINCSKEG